MEQIKGFLRYIIKYKNSRVDQVMFYLSLICIGLVVVHVGYITDAALASVTDKVIKGMFYGLFTLVSFRTIVTIIVERAVKLSQISSIILLAYFVFIALARLNTHSFFAKPEWVYLGIAILFLLELSRNSLFFDNFYFNPTILFVISFIALILLGTVLLMLPRTSLGAPLGFVDALFMASSAVCITGLSVVDLAHNFSLFGQTVVMLLIQVGGLGIMTFTGFFGYFFSGGFSYKNQLMFGEILGENKLNDVISTLLTIIFITLFFEFIGAVMIFASLDAQQFNSLGQRIFFSVFHAISSFCNSGFSILPDGIHHPAYRFNYAFQLCLSSIFILGGLGFGTVYNFYTYGKHAIKHFIRHRLLRKSYTHKAQIFSFNTRFVLVCNAVVVVLATSFYFLLERSATLADDHSLFGEWVTSFFMANSARSAGFNSVHVNLVASPTLIMLVVLMWVGSSPGSTGGGVKVTTVALAVLNIFALARGKESVEIHKRRVAPESINKAFAIIILSVLTIAISFVLLNFSDGEKPMKELLFEAVSAYTTCGLSLGVTHSLSPIGKMIIIFTMFVGRVGMLTLLVAFIKNTKNKSYIYPTEKILF